MSQTFRCRTDADVRASRMNRVTSSGVLDSCRMNLIATGRPSAACSALQTAPMPPSPIVAASSYFPPMSEPGLIIESGDSTLDADVRPGWTKAGGLCAALRAASVLSRTASAQPSDADTAAARALFSEGRAPPDSQQGGQGGDRVP